MDHKDVDRKALTIDLSQPPSIPEEGIERAVGVLRSGWLHRYGETLGDRSEVSLLEEAFAASVGAQYCVAANSCGSTMFLALVCSGVKRGDKVLMNAFTLAPVPGAIAHAGADHVLVEITPDLTMDLADFEAKAIASGAKHLLLSHMRGHITDLVAVMEIAARHGITVIEDCAHTMGASWAGKPTGTYGRVGCYSLQAYKHINGGEGGLLVTDDADIAARAILHSGSYMLYGQHRLRPSDEVFRALERRDAELLDAHVQPGGRDCTPATRLAAGTRTSMERAARSVGRRACADPRPCIATPTTGRSLRSKFDPVPRAGTR